MRIIKSDFTLTLNAIELNTMTAALRNAAEYHAMRHDEFINMGIAENRDYARKSYFDTAEYHGEKEKEIRELCRAICRATR